MKNFSSAWVKGSTNQKMSKVVDHATSEQHTTTMVQMQAGNAKASKVTTTCPLSAYCKMFFQNGYCYKRKEETV